MRKHHFAPKPDDPDHCEEYRCRYGPKHFMHKPPSASYVMAVRRAMNKAWSLADDFHLIGPIDDEEYEKLGREMRDISNRFRQELLRVQKIREEW